MSDSQPHKIPKTRPASSGNPPRPPKKTAHDLADGAPRGDYIDVPDPIAIEDLAAALRQEPQKILADALTFGKFSDIRAKISYEHAAYIAISYGFDARKVA